MKKRHAEMVLNHAVKEGDECFDNVLETLKRSVTEMERYKERYASADCDSKAEVLSWTTNYVTSNVLGNCRLDLMVSAAVKLTRASFELGHADDNNDEN